MTKQRFLSNPDAGENLVRGNLVMETGCMAARTLSIHLLTSSRTGCLRYLSGWDSYKGIPFSNEHVWQNCIHYSRVSTVAVVESADRANGANRGSGHRPRNLVLTWLLCVVCYCMLNIINHNMYRIMILLSMNMCVVLLICLTHILRCVIYYYAWLFVVYELCVVVYLLCIYIYIHIYTHIHVRMWTIYICAYT